MIIEPIEKLETLKCVHVKQNEKLFGHARIDTALSMESALELARKLNEVIEIVNTIIQKLNINIENVIPNLQLSEDQIKALEETFERNMKNRKGVEAYEG